jgi:hypothetical protein
MQPALRRRQVRHQPQEQNDTGIAMKRMMLGDTLGYQVEDHDGR